MPSGNGLIALNKAQSVGVFLIIFLALSYRWVTRELPFGAWVMCRLFETRTFRSMLHPEHFPPAANMTDAEAMGERRARLDNLTAKGRRVLQGDMAEVHDIDLAVKRGSVPLRVYVPGKAVGSKSHAYRGVVVWVHGGGWIFGSVDAYDAVARDLAEASGMITVNVGYRLAPEVKFPVPVWDCMAAVRWVKQNIWAFGGDKTRIAIVGESAGGNLALATAMALKRSWIPFLSKKSDLCAVVAASAPVSYDHALNGLDDSDHEWKSYQRYMTGYGLEATQMKAFWDLYLKKEKDGRRPLASPLRASKRMLRGLPPTMLIKAEHEILWDEVTDFGRKFAETGQQVVEIQHASCVHGLYAKGGTSCGQDSLEDSASFLREHCGGFS